jgi:hypothetical protein
VPRAQNLLTYKSMHETRDAWALDELIGHYLSHRKLKSVPTVSADGGEAGSTGTGSRLQPEADFQLYAVATRRPKGLCRGTGCRRS